MTGWCTIKKHWTFKICWFDIKFMLMSYFLLLNVLKGWGDIFSKCCSWGGEILQRCNYSYIPIIVAFLWQFHTTGRTARSLQMTTETTIVLWDWNCILFWLRITGFPCYVFMRTQQLHNYLYWEQLFIWFLVFNLPCSGFQFNITSTKLWMYHLHTQSCMLSNQPNPHYWMFISFTLGRMRQNGRMHNQEEVVHGLQ